MHAEEASRIVVPERGLILAQRIVKRASAHSSSLCISFLWIMNFLTFESMGDDESAHRKPHVNGAHKQQKGMKQGLLTRHFRLPVLVLIALAAVLPTQLFAQNTGTTIVFSKNTAHGLYGQKASNETKDNQWFAFLRHDIAHVQIQSSNNPYLNTNGSGAFAVNDNDMLFNSEGELRVTNFYKPKDGYYQQVCLAVIAPKGYRFTRYQWEVDKATLTSDASSEVNTCSLCEFTYENGKLTPKADSLTITQNLDKWDVTLEKGSNVLYFRLSTGQAAQVDVFIKTLKLTYVIDQPFDSQLPNSDATSKFHSGLLDFGTFSTKTITTSSDSVSYNVYQDANVTDLQEVSLYSKSNTEGSTVDEVTNPEIVTVDDNQYYVAAQNGDYYMEAPAKFRIVGATLKFLYNSDASQTKTTASDVTEITSGSAYVITDGNGHYLNNNNGKISAGTDLATATQWTITSSGSSGYTISNDGYYLYRGSGTSLSLSSYNRTSWSWGSSKGFYNKSSKRNNYYSLQYSDGWSLASSSSEPTTNAIKLQTVKTETITIDGSFTANAYKADDKSTLSEQGEKLTSSNASATITLSNYNNDAIHFSISGLADNASALYNVSLQLLPLNPELQNLSVGTQHTTDDVTRATAFTPVNYEFNSGNAVTVLVPEKEKSDVHTLTFLDAKNENRTQWYTTGKNKSTGAADYSNYFLVNSEADNGGKTSVSLDITKTPSPSARTTAKQAGTVKLIATNIEDVYDGSATTLQDNEFSKTAAAYDTATVKPDADEASTYYIYTADVPTYNILPSGTGTKHIDYRYYTLKVICKSVTETPKVEIVPLYTATLKGKNNKNSDIPADKGETLDESTKFYGVKVTAKATTGTDILGYLTSEQVVTAVKAAVKEQFGIDTLRGMLYLDLSSLTAVDYAKFDEDFNKSTADNCLYFMYPGFHRGDITNAIAKESAESNVYKAVSNIVVKDQQPFFTPYAFTTGTYTASYVRESTNGKALVKNMAVVLPFDISLDDKGHVKTASDNTDNTITYYNLTSQGELKNKNEESDGLTYGAVMEAITSGTAEANKPYYVKKSDSEDVEAGFSYKITDAKFKATPELTDNSENLTNQATEGAWTAVGTYAGVTPENDNTKWYFAKEMLWKSGALLNSTMFNVLPFRAYFEGEAANATKAKIVFSDDDIVTNGISNVNAENNGLTIAAANGAITISAAANTRYAVYTAAGQMVACGTLAAGESRTVKAQPGLYIVNNVKTIVK